MATKAQALAVAARFGFELDETNSGKVGDNYTVILDHPTHAIGADCRSITVSDYGSGDISPAAAAWAEAIERMQGEGPLLEPCTDPGCEYHGEVA